MALTVLRNGSGEVLTDGSGNALAINLPSGFTLTQTASAVRSVGTSGGGTSTFGSAILAGQFLVAWVANYPSGMASVTDTRGNTWVRGVICGDAGDNFGEVWYCLSAAAGSTAVTFTPVSTSDNYVSARVRAYTIPVGATVVIDASGVNNSGSSSSTTAVSTSVPTVDADELAAGVCVVDGDTPNAFFSVPTDWDQVDVEQNSGGFTAYQGVEQFTPAAGTIGVTFSHPGIGFADAAIVTFRLSYGAGPVNTSGVNRFGVREAASAKKAGKAAGVDRFGLRETARAAKQATTLGANRVGMRDAATGAKRATTSATERLGFRETGVGSLPANRVQVERFGMREAGRGTKQAPGAAQERAGVRDAAQASKAAAARSTERAGVRDQAAGRKVVTTSAAERLGVRETGVGSVFTGIVTFATERVGFREAVQTTATDAPQRQGAGGAGKTLMQHAMEQAHERRRRQRQKDEDQERGEREEQQREEAAATARQEAVRNVLRRPADVLAELSGVIDLEAPELAPDAVEDMLAAQALMAEQDARMAAEAERLALLEDDALALLVIEAALAV